MSSISCWTVLRVFNEREREPAKKITSNVIHRLLLNRNIKTYRTFCLEMETLQTRSARPNPRRAWTWCNWMLRWGSRGAFCCCLVSILLQSDPSMVIWLPISLNVINWKKRGRHAVVKYRDLESFPSGCFVDIVHLRSTMKVGSARIVIRTCEFNGWSFLFYNSLVTGKTKGYTICHVSLTSWKKKCRRKLCHCDYSEKTFDEFGNDSNWLCHDSNVLSVSNQGDSISQSWNLGGMPRNDQAVNDWLLSAFCRNNVNKLAIPDEWLPTITDALVRRQICHNY